MSHPDLGFRSYLFLDLFEKKKKWLLSIMTISLTDASLRVTLHYVLLTYRSFFLGWTQNFNL